MQIIIHHVFTVLKKKINLKFVIKILLVHQIFYPQYKKKDLNVLHYILIYIQYIKSVNN